MSADHALRFPIIEGIVAWDTGGSQVMLAHRGLTSEGRSKQIEKIGDKRKGLWLKTVPQLRKEEERVAAEMEKARKDALARAPKYN